MEAELRNSGREDLVAFWLDTLRRDIKYFERLAAKCQMEKKPVQIDMEGYNGA
jgi:hypothetical protein